MAKNPSGELLVVWQWILLAVDMASKDALIPEPEEGFNRPEVLRSIYAEIGSDVIKHMIPQERLAALRPLCIVIGSETLKALIDTGDMRRLEFSISATAMDSLKSKVDNAIRSERHGVKESRKKAAEEKTVRAYKAIVAKRKEKYEKMLGQIEPLITYEQVCEMCRLRGLKRATNEQLGEMYGISSARVGRLLEYGLSNEL